MSTDVPVALVTGALGGVGRAVTQRLLRRGYRVVMVHRREYPPTSVDFEGISSAYELYMCDVSDAPAVDNLARTLVDRYGRIDVCVHAAVDPIVRKQTLEQTLVEFKSQFDAALFGAFNIAHAVIPNMISTHGAFIVLTSVYADPRFRDQMHHLAFRGVHSKVAGYVAAKCALNGFLREFSAEVAALGVRVNTVVPDFLDTGLNGTLPARMLAWGAESRPQGRLMTPDEVASAVEFLACGDGVGLSGKAVLVDGLEVGDL